MGTVFPGDVRRNSGQIMARLRRLAWFGGWLPSLLGFRLWWCWSVLRVLVCRIGFSLLAKLRRVVVWCSYTGLGMDLGLVSSLGLVLGLSR